MSVQDLMGMLCLPKKIMFEKIARQRNMSIGRTDRSNTGQGTAGQSGGGIQLFLPI